MISVMTAIDIGSKVFDVEVAEIQGTSKKKNLGDVRACVSMLLKKYNLWNHSRIGDEVGIDRTTVYHHENLIHDSHIYLPQLWWRWQRCCELAEAAICGSKEFDSQPYILEKINLIDERIREAVKILTDCRSELNTVLTKIEKGMKDE